VSLYLVAGFDVDILRAKYILRNKLTYTMVFGLARYDIFLTWFRDFDPISF